MLAQFYWGSLVRLRTLPTRSDVKRKGTAAALMLLIEGLLSTYPIGARSQTLPQEEMEQSPLEPTANWSITLGTGVGSSPKYPGAKSYHIHPIFLGSIAYGNNAFLGPAGLGVSLINSDGFRFGPVLGYLGGRNQSDDPRLSGLGNIQPSISAGVFVAYRLGAFDLIGTFRQSIIHSNNGGIGRIQLNYRQSIITDKLTLDLGPQIDLGDGRYEKTWFGISQSQSGLSGLPAFTPTGGATAAGAYLNFTYRYSKSFLFRAFGSVDKYTGDVSDSPLFQTKIQAFVGLGIAYNWNTNDILN
jgi:MipA family protein